MSVSRLLDELPAGSVISDQALFARYSNDVTGRFAGTPAAVVRPSDVNEVAHVVRLCNEERIAVVPQGGNTGLVGGAIPDKDEIVLSLERLGAVGAVNAAT